MNNLSVPSNSKPTRLGGGSSGYTEPIPENRDSPGRQWICTDFVRDDPAFYDED
jgi:hypothetical protein